jgi:hypothetical protein
MFAARLVMIRSGKAIQESLKATRDKMVHQQDRLRIVSALAHVLSVCGLPGVGYHDQYRREVCSLPEFISQELEQEFAEISDMFSNENIGNALRNLCGIRKQTTIVRQVKRAIDAKVSMKEGNVLSLAFNDHEECPTVICKKGRVGELLANSQTILTDEMGFMVAKAEKLVENLNSNLAESFVAMMHMMLNGRRTNSQDGGVFTGQTLLAGLTMARDYSWHAAAQKAMGIEPKKVIETFAERINQRRKADKQKKRSRAKRRAESRI